MALETLFYGLKQCGGAPDGRTLFINAQAHTALSQDVVCVQWFKPYADALAGREVFSRIEDVSGVFDAAYVLVPKNMVEARYCVAQALKMLKPEGVLYCVADNKAGGTRLQKLVQHFSCEIVQQISKHKCRFVQGVKGANDQVVIDAAIVAGFMQTVDKTGFTAQAGVYGWDKIDRGSALLLRHVPSDLKGVIGDFGCGYGYLLQQIMQQNNVQNSGFKKIYAIDADMRAVDAARVNLSAVDAVTYLWADLRSVAAIPRDIQGRFDVIVMNPPFHEGKRSDSDIGVDFIKTAAASLRRNGALYMVANNQLPYETVLIDAFFTCEVLAQADGFKVFKAVK